MGEVKIPGPGMEKNDAWAADRQGAGGHRVPLDEHWRGLECLEHGVSLTTFDNWRKRFMDAGKRELAGIGGNGRSDPAKAQAKEIESLKIVVGEQTPANVESKARNRWLLRRDPQQQRPRAGRA